MVVTRCSSNVAGVEVSIQWVAQGCLGLYYVKTHQSLRGIRWT